MTEQKPLEQEKPEQKPDDPRRLLSPQKRGRNYAVLAILVLFVIIIFLVTVIRIKAGLGAAHG
jgi:hypothetical protein